MNLVIDTEFDGFFGELISMALVELDGDMEFYEVRDVVVNDKWVKKNVIPYLNKQSITDDQFQCQLQKFLMNSGEEIHVYADWPDDIRLLCQWIITGPGFCMDIPRMTFHWLDVDYNSAVAHNALEDARAIKKVINDQNQRNPSQ